VIRKEIMRNNEIMGDFENELHNLNLLNELKHPNIVELLGSYTHRDKHNLLFPMAQGGDLATLLTLKDRPSYFKEDETFFLALSELSSAIEMVHNYASERLDLKLIGCHHDLKPKNILVDKDTFILADFGLSKFKKATESSNTLFKIGGGFYLAPECEDYEDGFEKHTISRPSDIWSFGCIMADVLTYMKKGVDGLAEFKSKREIKIGSFKTYTFHAGRHEANKGVTTWLLDLKISGTQSDQLLIQLVRSMLSMEPSARPKAREVTSRLRFIAVGAYVRSICQQYDILSQTVESLEVDIERERFKSWAWSIKSTESDGDPWSYAIDTKLDFKSILKHLTRTRDELESTLSRCHDALNPLLVDLRLLNDQLTCLLPIEHRERARARLESSLLRTEDSSFLENMGNSLEATALHKRIGMLATVKRMSILVFERSKECRPDLRLDSKFVQCVEDFEDHSLAMVQKADETSERRVLVEWIRYGTHWEGPVSQEMVVRVEAIAELLNSPTKPDKFRVLHCSAFFHDPSRFAFGLVYEFPCSPSLSQQSLSPRTLNDILRISQDSRERPSLGDRFKVAYDLAVSVLEFHKVGWMHKSISAYNVVFFVTKGSKPVEWAKTAYIIGFNRSRPDEPAAFTEGPATDAKTRKYQHPEYSKTGLRFHPSFDYYSLGIILLEIGLWKTLDDMTRGWEVTSRNHLREMLVERRVPLLGHSMGVGYRNAVHACLEGKEDFGLQLDAEPIDGNTLSLLSFEKHVVEPLSQCFA
jgi:serine/threonine protein kinase